MFKIDNKNFIGTVMGITLASSLFGLNACNYSKKGTDLSVDTKMISYENSDCNHTALFLDGTSAILIPCNSVEIKDNDFLELELSDNNVTFSSDDITIFNDNKDQSSYEQAFNFALAVASEIYNYDDVLEGNYKNIALDYKIQSEMGIIK